jgi:hypothetical protein
MAAATRGQNTGVRFDAPLSEISAPVCCRAITAAFTACGCRAGYVCFRFAVRRDCSRPGISMVRVAGKLPLLFLSNTAAMSVDSIGHRRLRPQFALTFPEQAARFQREGCEPVQRPIGPDLLDAILKCRFRRRGLRNVRSAHKLWAKDSFAQMWSHRFFSTRQTRRLLSWPAPLCKDQPPRIGSTTKLACQFECRVAFRTWRHHAGKLQGVCCEVIPIEPVS